MFTLGIDLGSSSVKASVLNVQTGKIVVDAVYPDAEFPIDAPHPGWAEQDTEMWWEGIQRAIQRLADQRSLSDISAIGIAYQMHGLVLVDSIGRSLRPSIIWCDSRATSIGENAFEQIGREVCLSHLLNSPGNFTAAKLRWVQARQPEIYRRAYKFMLPGDYIAYRLTGEMTTTMSGLSEGILWDFKYHRPAQQVLDHFHIDPNLLPEIVPTFGIQGKIKTAVADELGLPRDIPVAYRAGDQPNNAFSLGVLHPGEVAATAGTSGVVYGVSGSVKYDIQSRVNTFAHVNHNAEHPHLGVLLCVNGTGSVYRWLRDTLEPGASYDALNANAESISIGSDGVTVLPFGNGAERMLANSYPGIWITGLDVNRHRKEHILRAGQEGIAFAFAYGMEILSELDVPLKTIRAGRANMFLSDVFCQTLATVTGATIELFETDGAAGAARGAAVGAGLVKLPDEILKPVSRVGRIEPAEPHERQTNEAYSRWLRLLNASGVV